MEFNSSFLEFLTRFALLVEEKTIATQRTVELTLQLTELEQKYDGLALDNAHYIEINTTLSKEIEKISSDLTDVKKLYDKEIHINDEVINENHKLKEELNKLKTKQ